MYSFSYHVIDIIHWRPPYHPKPGSADAIALQQQTVLRLLVYGLQHGSLILYKRAQTQGHQRYLLLLLFFTLLSTRASCHKTSQTDRPVYHISGQAEPPMTYIPMFDVRTNELQTNAFKHVTERGKHKGKVAAIDPCCSSWSFRSVSYAPTWGQWFQWRGLTLIRLVLWKCWFNVWLAIGPNGINSLIFYKKFHSY